MRILVFIFSFIFLLNSCGVSKHLVYIDDWQGSYTLREYNSCCDTATQVKMRLMKTNPNEYDWKLFFIKNDTDTIYGKALYKKNKLNFFVVNTDIGNKYFENAIESTFPVFRLEYDNYSSDESFLYVDHFTRWLNELKNYKQRKVLFAGTSYHFKRDGVNSQRKLPKA